MCWHPFSVYSVHTKTKKMHILYRCCIKPIQQSKAHRRESGCDGSNTTPLSSSVAKQYCANHAHTMSAMVIAFKMREYLHTHYCFPFLFKGAFQIGTIEDGCMDFLKDTPHHTINRHSSDAIEEDVYMIGCV